MFLIENVPFFCKIKMILFSPLMIFSYPFSSEEKITKLYSSKKKYLILIQKKLMDNVIIPNECHKPGCVKIQNHFPAKIKVFHFATFLPHFTVAGKSLLSN